MKRLLLISAAVAAFAMSSCVKDDDAISMYEYRAMRELAPTDVEAAGLFGPVKQWTETSYSASIVDGEPVEGTPWGRIVTNFNEKGYITTQLHYEYVDGEFELHHKDTYSHDGSGRVLWLLSDFGDEAEKITVTYNDAAGYGVVKYWYQDEDGEFVQQDFIREIRLNPYGRLEEPINGFMPMMGRATVDYTNVAERDSYNNVTFQCRYSASGVGYYIKSSYLYY